jgi:redox-sensitive bicupin YhaK (pirin superfamily)
MDRRTVLTALVSTPLVEACKSTPAESVGPQVRDEPVELVKLVEPLGQQWRTPDPFLFCVHHDDAYPAGNGALGPAVSLAGRPLGSDFSRQDGFSMYHGEVVPGFPQHPHRGFETVTVVRRGLVDHSDSLGAAARYGHGDVQWLTAGKGIVHAEMFPLLDASSPNPLELFQIWLNLPARDKFVEPHFSMLWRDSIPTVVKKDANGRAATITVVAGAFGDVRPPSPPPHSYASRPESGVAIWTLKLEPNAELTLPAAAAGSLRMLYYFRGASLLVGGREFASGNSHEVKADASLRLQNGTAESELLLLGGRPLGEPVAKRGPFVMNTQAEIQQAFSDYRATRFGGWPWDRDDPVHGKEPQRFARHADGRTERA